jgi:transcriptional regulator with XRE-family HTH domain
MRLTPPSSGSLSLGGVSNDLGSRLRQARERKGFTVRGLARYVGVSPSLVSQIERGHVMPSVGTLYLITNQLDLVVDDLFKDAAAGASANRDTAHKNAADPIQRPTGRKTIRLAEGVRWERLTPRPDPEVEFLYVVYEPGAESCDKDSLIRHGGKEYAYMMSGRLGLKLGFEEFQLEPGDSITFDAQMPHRLWTIGKKPAEAIWIVYNRHGDSRPGTPARKSALLTQDMRDQ